MLATPACTSNVGPVETVLFDLDLSAELMATTYVHLDPGERLRAAAFRFDRDRHRFVARRGQLRARLAQQVGGRPCDLLIDADENGKPFLPDHPQLHFNLSYSRDLALCAIGEGVRVGCDIEWCCPELACRDVAARLFAPGEYADLTALPTEEWIRGFFRCWTRNEAYVKALGLGLSYPLDAFRVSVREAAHLIEAQPGWSLSSFEPTPGYQAALVVGTG